MMCCIVVGGVGVANSSSNNGSDSNKNLVTGIVFEAVHAH
jgi:hypothetical protein